MYDRDGALLYIGSSTNLPGRLYTHNSAAPFWPEVSLVAVEHFETKEGAEAAERMAISQERPRINIQHNLHPVSDYQIPEYLARQIDERVRKSGRFR
jgi:hypothetical protein